MTHLIDDELGRRLAEASDSNARADLLIAYLDRNGRTNYDESVTQLEHAVQTATLARTAGAGAEAVTASLLHDLGHLLIDEHVEAGDFLEHDLGHEKVAASYLEPFFGPAVTEAIRLHVRAKRYLCTVDPAYHDDLSEASKRSLEVQGGTLTSDEAAAFETNAHHGTAVDLRRWDDRAKVSGLEVGGLHAFHSDVVAALDASGHRVE